MRTPGLFEAVGVELEYMIVDAASLDVLPKSDEIIYAVAREYTSEIERDTLAWSNELVLHVLEIKTNGPAASLAGLDDAVMEDVGDAVTLLRLGMPMQRRAHPAAHHRADTETHTAKEHS